VTTLFWVFVGAMVGPAVAVFALTIVDALKARKPSTCDWPSFNPSVDEKYTSISWIPRLVGALFLFLVLVFTSGLRWR
jgi:hypothetical protein